MLLTLGRLRRASRFRQVAFDVEPHFSSAIEMGNMRYDFSTEGSQNPALDQPIRPPPRGVIDVFFWWRRGYAVDESYQALAFYETEHLLFPRLVVVVPVSIAAQLQRDEARHVDRAGAALRGRSWG